MSEYTKLYHIMMHIYPFFFPKHKIPPGTFNYDDMIDMNYNMWEHFDKHNRRLEPACHVQEGYNDEDIHKVIFMGTFTWTKMPRIIYELSKTSI